jgi:hypothetical protein
MKSSEFIHKQWEKNGELTLSQIYKFLDKRFIDKKELKEKILILKEKSKDFECCIELCDEFLKMLKGD